MNQKSIMREIGEKLLALSLVLVMLFSAFPLIGVDLDVDADAAQVEVADTSASVTSGSGTWISGKLTYNYSVATGSDNTSGANGSVSASSNTLTVKATSAKQYDTGGCNSTTVAAAATTTTVTVTNASSYPLKFNTISTTGSASVAGVSQGDTIASGAQFTISVTSPANGTNNTEKSGTVTVSVEEQTSVTITLKPSPYVGYTVNNKTVAQNGSDQTFSVDAGTSVSLPSVTPPTGYEFKGWRVGSNLVTGSSFIADAGYTVFPVIVTAGTDITAANFKVGSTTYTFWEDAVTAAVSGSGTMFVNLENVALPTNVLDNLLPASGGTYVKPVSGGGVEYILPAGVTMVVPYSTSTTIHTTTPAYGYKQRVNPSPFRILTVPNGAKITVNGAVSVDSYVCAYGQSNQGNGTPSGPHGMIVMKTGSEMTLNSGANLYCYGYINGDGNIYVKSGAKVYELFQFCDWRGGNGTNDIEGNSYRVFPMSQYYVQNVEAPMTLYKGATEYVWSVVNMSSSPYATNQIEFIGTNGMFKLTGGNSDYIMKRYHANVDRLEITAHGDMSLNNLTVSIGGLPLIGTISMNSKDYVLPLNNMNIVIDTGTTSLASSQTYGVAFLPSSKLTVNSGATFSVNAPVYFYDSDDWGGYCGASNLKLVVSGYSTANGTTAIRTADNLVDAELDVNGTVTVSNKLYTTEHGAHITSSQGTGKIQFTTACATGTATTYQATQSGSSISAYPAITVNNAWLLNGDESYSKTVGTGTSTWKYDKDGEHWYRYLVDFNFNGNNIARDYYCENNDTVTYDASWLTDLGASVTSGSATAAVSGTDVNVTNVTADSVVTLTGDPAEYKPTFVLSEEEYTKHYLLYNSTELTNTTTINGETYYIVDQGGALAVGTAYAAPTDAAMGVSTANHNGFLWNLSGVSFTSGDPYRGTVPAGETAGGPAYIYGFYSGVVAHNSWNDQYYSTLIDAFSVLPQDVSATITLLADCGTFEEESGTVAYTAYPANNITLDLNGHHATGRISNGGTFTLELNGGALECVTGSTAPSANYKGMSTVINGGTMVIQDSVGGGMISNDATSNTSGVDGSNVIRNLAGATLTVTGKASDDLLTIKENQTEVTYNSSYGYYAYNYGIYNLGRITALTNVDVTTAHSRTTGVNIYNYNTGVIDSISGGHMYAYSGSSIFNYGGTITTIDGLTIDGKNGITNRNIRGGSQANGWTVAEADIGNITTITNCDIQVGQYAIYNHARITTIKDSTLIAQPDTAQVDTRGDGLATASDGNIQCYSLYNSNEWWYNTSIWKQTDNSSGGYTRVNYYREEEQYRPIIGEITNCNIYGEITSTSASHGYALTNSGGVIGKIGGTTDIQVYKHPDNAKSIVAHYAMHNLAGGIIKSIEGTVNVSVSGIGAVYNDGAFTTQINYTYGNKVGGNITYQKNTYGEPSTINSITCSGTWSCGGSSSYYYALYNTGYIQTINAPELTLEGGCNVLYNATGSANSTYEINRYYTDVATASTEYKKVQTYVKNLEKGSTIGTINGITITGKGTKSYYVLNNQGHIGTLSNTTVNFADGATANSSYYVAALNGDSRYKNYTETIQTKRTAETDPHLTVSDGIVTKYDRDYTYDTPTIDTIDNLTVNSITLYAMRNAGHIGTMKNSTITGTQYAMHNSDSGPYTERQSEQYYSGTSNFATTKASSDLSNHYKKTASTIGLIDNCTITTPANTYAMLNGGHVGTIKNSTLQSGTTTAKAYALANTGNTIREYTRDLSDIVYITANGGSSCTTYYGSGGETNVVTYDYDAPEIDLIGEGNTFKATAPVITNTGIIHEINSGEGTKTTVTESAAKYYAIYNYSANLNTRTTTTPYTAATAASTSGTAGTAVNDDTLQPGAQIDTIKNVYINSNGYGILNGDASAGKLPTIGEIGEGTEIYAHCTTAGYHAIYNQANAKVAKITGGVYTTTKATTNAYRNNNTDPNLVTEISGGDFKGMSAKRANAIFEPDNTNRQIYSTGKTLSSASRSVNFNNGTTVASGTGYYYINNTYTVSFNRQNHGTAPADQTVESGLKATEPTAPTEEGWTFGGWYKEAACTNAWNFGSDKVTADTTLYAKWTTTVTFDANGHGTAPAALTGVADGSKITAPADAPSEEGWFFGGWYTDADCNTAWDFDNDTVTAPTTLYAKWTQITYTITWVNGDESSTTSTVAHGSQPTAPFTPSKDQTVEATYTFSGWKSSVNNQVYSASDLPNATGDVTYTATFSESPRKYTITWVNGDGSGTTSQVAYGTQPTAPITPSKAQTAEFTYTFSGWKSSANSQVYAAADLPNVTGAVTYTAQFTPVTRSYDVTFNMQNHGSAVDKQTVAYNGKASKPASPADGDIVTDSGSDYRFDGWYKDSGCTTEWNFDSDTITGVTTIYAKWTTVHTVTFEDESGTTTEEVVAANEQITVPAVPAKAPDPQYSYTPSCWKDESSDATVTAGSTITASDDVTYEPVYTSSVNKYEVSWVDEDGTALANDTVVAYGSTPECPLDTVPTKEPTAQYTYTFSHWEVTVAEWNASQIVTDDGPASTGAAPKAIASIGASAAFTAVGDGDGTLDSGIVSLTGKTTYRAVFTSTVNEYTVTWMNGDTKIKEDLLAYGTALTVPSDPTRASANGKVYFFTGWSDGTHTYAKGESIPAVEGNVTYTALFQEENIFNKHSLTLDGTIGVNFYVYLPEGYTVDNTTMDFSWGNKYISTNTYSETEPYTKTGVTGKQDGSYVKFTVPVAAKELNDEITAVLKDKTTGETIATEKYRGTDYAYRVLGMNHDQFAEAFPNKVNKEAEFRELIRTMLIYCAAAQVNFAYHTDNLATYKFESMNISDVLADVNTDTLVSNNVSGLPSNMTYYGSSLNLGSDTALDIFIINRSTDTFPVTATYSDGSDANTDFVRSGSAVKCEVSNIAAARITDMITMTINGCEIQVSTQEYIKNVLTTKSSDDPLYKVCAALYHYNRSAKAYY